MGPSKKVGERTKDKPDVDVDVKDVDVKSQDVTYQMWMDERGCSLAAESYDLNLRL